MIFKDPIWSCNSVFNGNWYKAFAFCSGKTATYMLIHVSFCWLYMYILIFRFQKKPSSFSNNPSLQAGAELYQSQGKLDLFLPWLNPCLLWLTLTLFWFVNLTYEFNFRLQCLVWTGFIPRLGIYKFCA